MEKHDIIPEFIAAWLLGEANKEQSLQTEEWLKNPDNQRIYAQLEKLDRLSDDFKLLKDFNVKEGKQRVISKSRTNKLLVLSGWLQRIAAVLFIPVLLGGIWYYHQQKELRKDIANLMVTQEIITQPGTKTHLFLPDSTEVWLNASSSLQFPSAFAGNERRIELDGEAYFKVFHNKRKPFIVNTAVFNVQALGTSFNISAYKGDPKFSATLEEGKVKISDMKDTEKVMFLEPDGQLNYNLLDQSYKTQNVRVKDVIAWKDGILIFNETPFYEVAAKLGRWFNASIQISDKSIANYRFTGTFTSESLDQVMELITMSTPISYSISKREILDNKSFSKQEIKIWKNPNAKIKLNKDKSKPMK